MQCGCIGNVCRTLGIIGYIKRILERIIEDEKIHIECLQKAYHEYCGKICE